MVWMGTLSMSGVELQCRATQCSGLHGKTAGSCCKNGHCSAVMLCKQSCMQSETYSGHCSVLDCAGEVGLYNSSRRGWWDLPVCWRIGTARCQEQSTGKNRRRKSWCKFCCILFLRLLIKSMSISGGHAIFCWAWNCWYFNNEVYKGSKFDLISFGIIYL